MRNRRSLRYYLNLLVPVVIFVPVLAYIFIARIGYDSTSLTHPPLPPENPTINYEDVSFPSRNQNYLVHAFFYPADAPGSPAIITVHGYRGNRRDGYQLVIAPLLHDLGYTVISVDLSDNGGDTTGNGRISMGFSERWDVLGAYDYLLTRGFKPGHIGLVGESMGAATSLLAAAQEPGIRAIWSDSGYTRADTVLSEQAEEAGFPRIIVPGGLIWGVLLSGDRIWEAAPIDAGPTLGANKQAVYLIHCEHDTKVLFHHSVEMNTAFKAAGVDVTFWDVPDGGHVSALDAHRAEYLQRLDGFFKQHLVS